jgi:hypothetical protein
MISSGNNKKERKGKEKKTNQNQKKHKKENRASSDAGLTHGLADSPLTIGQA